jgi:radical SAM protein with 4Fe4S-binding SPASM domain
MSQKLALSSAAILRSEPQYYGTFAVFDCNRVTTEYLTAEELRTLEYISDKSADVKEISERAEINCRKCEKFIKRMKKLGYVRAGDSVLERKSPERIKIDREVFRKFQVPFLSAPTSVDVFITSRCNLRCVHCFASGEMDKGHELPFGHLESIFDQLEKMGVFEIRINGGEPLLHREIRKILSGLRRRRFRKVMLTNGTLLDEETVLLLKESRVIPTVSLDDSAADRHDLFRGVKGSFDRTIDALGILQKHGIEYGINCCLHKNNMGRLEEVIDLAVQHGAKRIAFLDLKPVGRMMSHRDWVPSYREYEKLMKYLEAARVRHKWIDVSRDVFTHCLPMRESVLEAKKGYVSCYAGKTRLSVDSTGLVYPCNLVLSDPQWVMGDTGKEKIWDIWFSEKWSFFRGKVKINDLRKCRSCKDLKKCDDFYCRLLPYSSDGDVFGPHPKCK